MVCHSWNKAQDVKDLVQVALLTSHSLNGILITRKLVGILQLLGTQLPAEVMSRKHTSSMVPHVGRCCLAALAQFCESLAAFPVYGLAVYKMTYVVGFVRVLFS